MTKVQGNDGAPFNIHNSESAGLQLNLQPIEEGKKIPNGAVSSFHRVRTFLTLRPTDLYCGLVGLEQQSRSRLQESPQLDLVLPADGELTVSQGEDLIDSIFSQQVVLQFLWQNEQTHNDCEVCKCWVG